MVKGLTVAKTLRKQLITKTKVEDLKYITDTLTADDQLCAVVAAMLRSGALNAREEPEEEQCLGPRLKPYQKRFRHLKRQQLVKIIKACSPGTPTDMLAESDEATLSQVVTFALNANGDTPLPFKFKFASYENPLAKICAQWHKKLGERLKSLGSAGLDDFQGYYAIDDVKTGVIKKMAGDGVGKTLTIPRGVWSQTDDWEIRNPFSLNATIFSESLQESLNLQPRFQKLGVQDRAEDVEWDIMDMALAPVADDETGSSAGRSSVPATPRRSVEADEPPRTPASTKSAIAMEFEDWEARLSGAGGVEMPVEDKND